MAQGQENAERGGAEAARRRRARRFRIFGAILIVLALAGGAYWLLTKGHETTDDAFVEANVVQVAPQVGGVVKAIHFDDNQWVDAGKVLVEIDPRDYEVALASARASLLDAEAQRNAAKADLELTRTTTGAAVDEARHAVEQGRRTVGEIHQQADANAADAARADADMERYQELFRRADASKQRLDQAVADARSTNARWRASQLAGKVAESNLAQAQARLQDALAAPQRIAMKEAQLADADARVKKAEADVRAAELNLSYTVITAPQSGRIAKRAVNAGDVVQKNQILTNLVLDPPWVVANFKETQLTHMRPGQAATVEVDAFPGHHFHARVDSIQPGSGPRFSLLPPENATGNYVKVVQRVPVKIVFDDLSDQMVHLLVPGMSVVPDVDVAAPTARK